MTTVLVLRSALEASDMTPEQLDRRRAESLAILAAVLPDEALAALAYTLEACAKERVHGGLDVSVNMADGRVRSLDLARRTHWQQRRG